MLEELKKNLAMYGYMTPAQQGKAREIGVGNFEFLDNNGDFVPCSAGDTLLRGIRYRLRPDYEGTPIAVKCEVVTKDGIMGCEHEFGSRSSTEGPMMWMVDCPCHPDFIGFLYEGTQVSALPRAYTDEGCFLHATTPMCIENHSVKELIPTHVLFRGKK